MTSIKEIFPKKNQSFNVDNFPTAHSAVFKIGSLLGGLAIGATAGYFFDPVLGLKRRNDLKAQSLSLFNHLSKDLQRTAVDLKNRAQGAFIESQRLFSQADEYVDDLTLNQRVRSNFGRLVGHPHAIKTSVTDQVVTLSGHILASEIDALIEGVSKVRGVKDIVNNLQIHISSEGISSLQDANSRHT